MKCHTRKLLKASLITPWMVLPISALFSLYYLCTWIGKPLPDPAVTLIWPHPFKPWARVMLYSLYGVPTAYAALLLIGIPCYLAARKMNMLSRKTALCAALLASIPAAFVYGGTDHFWKLFAFLILFGIPIACVFAWFMKDGETKNGE